MFSIHPESNIKSIMSFSLILCSEILYDPKRERERERERERGK